MPVLTNWNNRSVISANLFNPAFCGEVLRRAIDGYNQNEQESKMPYSLFCLVLPIVLHKGTRENMPTRSNTYFHSWVNNHEYLFIDFAERVRQLLPYSREALMFLLKQKVLEIDEAGQLFIIQPYRKKNPKGIDVEEVKQILRKAELLGKWLRLTGNEQTIYMFLKIRP